jgi:hypothetical protein
VDAAPSQNIADEEAQIAKQIESFMDKVPTASAEPAAAPAPAETPPAPAETAPATKEETPPTDQTAATPEPAAAPAPKSAGEKVIQPLNDPTKPTGPSIHELAAKEEEKEQAASAQTPPATPPAPANGGIDPNSLAL